MESPTRVQFAKASSRRAAFAAAGLGASAVLLAATRSEAATASSASQNVIALGADPTGTFDSVPAFLRAFAGLPATGGTIMVPPGRYQLKSQLVFSGKALCILGDSSASTILLMEHRGTAIIYLGNDVGYPSATPFSVKGISIAGPISGPAALGAIEASYVYSANETGYQYVLIDDVSVGCASINAANGCNITHGITLANVWKGLIKNTRMFGPFGSGVFANLGGTKNIDITFAECVSDGPYYGVAVTSYTEGLRLINSTFISQVGVSTSLFKSPGGINLLGLYIIGGEFNTFTRAADLFQVNQGYVADTHFSYQGSASPAVVTMENCVAVRMSNLIFAGEFPPNGGSVYGLQMTGCSLCQVNGALFVNLNSGLLYGPACEANMATALQLVDEYRYPQLNGIPAAVDQSGVVGFGANNAQWMSATGGFLTLR